MSQNARRNRAVAGSTKRRARSRATTRQTLPDAALARRARGRLSPRKRANRQRLGPVGEWPLARSSFSDRQLPRLWKRRSFTRAAFIVR